MSWSKDDVRKMMDEISTEHMQEALDGKMGMRPGKRKAYMLNRILGYGIAAAVIILMLGVATFNIFREKQDFQPAGLETEDTTADEKENMYTSEEEYEYYAQITVDQVNRIYDDYLSYFQNWKHNGTNKLNLSVLPDLNFDDDPWKSVICKVRGTTCHVRLNSGAAYIVQTQGAYAGTWLMDEMSWDDICKILKNKEKVIYDEQIVHLWNAKDNNGLISEDEIYNCLNKDDFIQVYEEGKYKIKLPVYTLYESEFYINVFSSVGYDKNDNDYMGFKVTITENNDAKPFLLSDFYSEDQIKGFLKGLR